MSDPRRPPPMRLRSRHRRFDQRRADRARLRGSLIVDGLALVGAGIWWWTGHWPVAAAWAGATLLTTLLTLHGYRRPSSSVGPDERWRRRGLPGPTTVAVVLGMAVVVGVTLRFGVGWTWGDSLLIPSTTALSSLFFAWRDARRYRRTVHRATGTEYP